MSTMKTSEVEREVTEAVHWRSGHWGAVMAFCGILMAMPEEEEEVTFI